MKLMKAASSAVAATYDVAVIGGGIAGCAVARSLALNSGGAAKVTIYEIGRGPGGRASTRRTRNIPGLGINHGAPYADLATKAGQELAKSMSFPEFVGRRGSIDPETGSFDPTSGDDASNTHTYVTGENQDMANLSATMLSSIQDSAVSGAVTTRYSSMVRGLSYNPPSDDPNQRWTLSDKEGKTLGTADWLVVAGSVVAHPRWTNVFLGDPPLVAAAKKIGDPTLDGALECITKQELSPVLVVFFYCTGDLAKEWMGLNFAVAEVSRSDALSKIMVQPNKEGDGCAVVLHSTKTYAQSNTGVFGSSSSAARVGDASSNASRENEIIGDMLAALSGIPGMPNASKEGKESITYGPLLHRWGGAFPVGTPLAESLSLCESSQVGFCGDYADTAARIGSVEAALLSGNNLGERIARQMSPL